MSSVVIAGDTSGTVTLAAPAVSGTTTLTLPATTDTLVGKTTTDTLTNKTLTSPTITGASVSSMASSVITSGTAVASTSGTSIDFTSIPSWVKRITVMFSAVSSNGTSLLQVQLGTSGGVQTSGYSSVGQTSGGSNVSSTGLLFSYRMEAIQSVHGSCTLCLLNSSTGLWVWSGVNTYSTADSNSFLAGSKTLSGTLDRIRITTVNGTDTFDAGSVNILYE